MSAEPKWLVRESECMTHSTCVNRVNLAIVGSVLAGIALSTYKRSTKHLTNVRRSTEEASLSRTPHNLVLHANVSV
jgi:hypothetical protein